MSLKSKIQSLITAANTATGETDTNLTDAVSTLIDGYGAGGGDIFENILNAEYIGHIISAQLLSQEGGNHEIETFLTSAVPDTGTYFFCLDGFWLSQIDETYGKLLIACVKNGNPVQGALRCSSNVTNELQRINVVINWLDGHTNLYVSANAEYKIYKRKEI